MSHGSDSCQLMQQANILRALRERIVADHRRHRLATKLPVAAGIDVTKVDALAELRGIVKVSEQLLRRDI